MFRRRNDALEVLLVHPGGPFFRNKDDGVWTVPKGEIEEGEDLLNRARTEFEEEVGIPADGDWKFAGQFPGLLEQFRNGVAAALENDAKFSGSRSSLLFFTGRGEEEIESSANTLS